MSPRPTGITDGHIISVHPQNLGINLSQTDSDSGDRPPGWSPGFCISNKPPGDPMGLTQGPHLGSNSLLRLQNPAQDRPLLSSIFFSLPTTINGSSVLCIRSTFCPYFQLTPLSKFSCAFISLLLLHMGAVLSFLLGLVSCVRLLALGWRWVCYWPPFHLILSPVSCARGRSVGSVWWWVSSGRSTSNHRGHPINFPPFYSLFTNLSGYFYFLTSFPMVSVQWPLSTIIQNTAPKNKHVRSFTPSPTLLLHLHHLQPPHSYLVPDLSATE